MFVPMVTAQFQIRLNSHKTGQTMYGPVFSNIVLDSGLDLLSDYTLQEVASVINVGNGSALPDQRGVLTEIDGEESWYPGLDNFVASSSSSIGWEGSFDYTDPAHMEMFNIFSFGPGGFVGEISEVGLSRAPDAGYFNRQLLRDTIGTPTRVRVLEEDELQIACWVYVYLNRQSDEPPIDSSFIFNGETINAQAHLNTSGIGEAPLRGFTGKISHAKLELSETSQISFSRSSSLAVSAVESYVPGSFTRKYKASHSPGSIAGEFHTIYIGWGAGSGWTAFTAYQLETPIVMTDEEIFEMEFERSWGRYEV